LLLIVLLLAGFSAGWAQPIPLVASPPVAAAGRPKPAPGLAKGVVAPAFQLQDAAGNTVALSDFRGKVVYLDF